ncbi:DUF1672 family protein [Lentibacillus sp. N15]|uniref:DUF1672 family protein n=1 Tax=Lentibacillus songyuanensis TaxID=3136161 RepID=UPI0031BBC6CB
MDDSKSNDKTNKHETNTVDDKKNEYEKENFVPIQEYTGQGYTLRDSRPETGQIANEHHNEVEKAVQHFFKDKYKTEVAVHNIVSAADGVSVFVESVGEPHFYTFAIVPIDIKTKKIETDSVWSQEGQVENAIKGGLYAMAFEDKFSNLDKYMEEITNDYPVVGTPVKAVGNVMGTGYSTPYYFIAPSGDVFKKLYQLYESNPNINKQDIKIFFKENKFEPRYLNIGIELYMKKSHVTPDKDIYDKIYTDIKEMENIPSGEYSIILNDNYIDQKRAIGQKDNSIDKTRAKGILKNSKGD